MKKVNSKWSFLLLLYNDLGLNHVLNGRRLFTLPFQLLSRIERKMRQRIKQDHYSFFRLSSPPCQLVYPETVTIRVKFRGTIFTVVTTPIELVPLSSGEFHQLCFVNEPVQCVI